MSDAFAGTRGSVEPHSALLNALQAILAEVIGPERPYSVDSYLPAHLIEQAQFVVDNASKGGCTSQKTTA